MGVGVYGSAQISITKVYGPTLLALQGFVGGKISRKKHYVRLELSLNTLWLGSVIQRCCPRSSQWSLFAVAADDFLDMIAGIQGSRMNDQRAHLSDFPGLQDSDVVMAPFMTEQLIGSHTSLDDQFFEMLMKCQVGTVMRGLYCEDWGVFVVLHSSFDAK